jgi:DNA-binding Lrp family transcriptional regulator
MTERPTTRAAILAHIEKKGTATSAELARRLRVTRQAIHQQLRALVDSGLIVKTGSTRGARYFRADDAAAPETFRSQYTLEGLDESDVYTRVAAALNLRRSLRPNVESIVRYAFTEMLNNAIDHSKAARCRVEVALDPAWLVFEVKDRGIGIYQSIAGKHALPDEQAAMIELIKGKTTTMPEAHSGEGIFFTCRAADRLILRSHKIQMEWSRTFDDVFVSVPRFTKGTTVRFEIRRDSRRKLEDVFAEFAPREFDYRFEKTNVLVRLLQSDYVSRSEAKRLVLNLDRFAEINLDMRGVRRLGQGFADEVFRVFAAKHPGTRVRVLNANPNVAAMVRHAGGTAA